MKSVFTTSREYVQTCQQYKWKKDNGGLVDLLPARWQLDNLNYSILQTCLLVEKLWTRLKRLWSVCAPESESSQLQSSSCEVQVEHLSSTCKHLSCWFWRGWITTPTLTNAVLNISDLKCTRTVRRLFIPSTLQVHWVLVFIARVGTRRESEPRTLAADMKLNWRHKYNNRAPIEEIRVWTEASRNVSSSLFSLWPIITDCF